MKTGAARNIREKPGERPAPGARLGRPCMMRLVDKPSHYGSYGIHLAFAHKEINEPSVAKLTGEDYIVQSHISQNVVK